MATSGNVTLYAKWINTSVKNPFTLKDVTKNISKKKQSVNIRQLIGNADADTGFSYTLNTKNVQNAKGISISAQGVLTIPKKAAGIITVTVTSKKTTKYIETSQSLNVYVAPSKVKKVKAVSANKKGSVKITWKLSEFADGYEIKCSSDSKFPKGKKTKTVKVGKKADSYVMNGMDSGKKCFVQIRAYKKIGKTIIYSEITKGNLKKVK